MARKKEMVIPPAMMPEQGMQEVRGADGKTYLLRNDAMYTGVQHSQAEFSEFFLALRDEGKIFGHRCPVCRHIIIPPFMARCPSCNFIEMEKEYVEDMGALAATPVITIFAPSRFKKDVPFGTGRVFLQTQDRGETDTAMLVRVRTTQGALRPGIFRKGTPVKVVFANKRRGEMLDIFAVPQEELTPSQLAKNPLMERDLRWNRMPEIDFGRPSANTRAVLQAVIGGFHELEDKIAKSPRAKKDLAHWRRAVHVRTAGGSFAFFIENGSLAVLDETPAKADIVMTVREPRVLYRWLKDITDTPDNPESPPLTDLVLDGEILLSKNELETITRLDRLPRSLRRDGV